MDTKSNIYVGRKVVGFVKGKIFHKDVFESRHLLRKPPAIAFDIVSIAQAINLGAVWIEVTGKETGLTYKTSFKDLLEKGIKVNRGYGEQLALPLYFWKTGE